VRVTVTVLGGCGGWPTAGAACSGYLVEFDGFRALIDPGYATFPRLLEHCDAAEVGAVLISHGHPDHCADLNPLLRARVLGDTTIPPLPVFAPPGSLDKVLALDRPGMLDGGLEWREFHPGSSFQAGPFTVQTWPLPHWVPNAGLRLRAAGTVIAYTGDTGPSPDLAALAIGADVLIADASYADRVPADAERYLSSATAAGRVAGAADAGRLVLAHLMPGTDPDACARAASASYGGAIDVAVPGLTIGALRRWPRAGVADAEVTGELPRSRELSGIVPPPARHGAARGRGPPCAANGASSRNCRIPRSARRRGRRAIRPA
jgi:ribonuclease BN (tRNA processing enzyme)